MIQDWRTLERPNVGFKMYWKEIVLLFFAILTPFISWCGWKDPNIFAASGSIMVFFSVLSEFLLLNKLNVKHINCEFRMEKNHYAFRFVLKLSHGVHYLLLLLEQLFGVLVKDSFKEKDITNHFSQPPYAVVEFNR